MGDCVRACVCEFSPQTHPLSNSRVQQMDDRLYLMRTELKREQYSNVHKVRTRSRRLRQPLLFTAERLIRHPDLIC